MFGENLGRQVVCCSFCIGIILIVVVQVAVLLLSPQVLHLQAELQKSHVSTVLSVRCADCALLARATYTSTWLPDVRGVQQPMPRWTHYGYCQPACC